MFIKRAEIGDFPLSTNARIKYDVVYLGEVIRNYISSSIPELLYNNYVFLFSTTLNDCEDTSDYGHVNINLIHHDRLSYFNHILRDRGSFHVLKDEPLNINEFLEVIPEESAHGLRVVAHLKKQNFLNKDLEIVKSRDFRVLLVKENLSDYDNIPVLELGPEFQAEIDKENALEKAHNLSRCTRVLKGVNNRNKSQAQLEDAMKVVMAALDIELEDAERESERASDFYSDLIRGLAYRNKFNHYS